MLPPLLTSTKKNQLEIHQKCHHPDGNWVPFDWQHPSQTIPERITNLTEEHPERTAIIDHTKTLTYFELDTATNAVAASILEQQGSGQEVIALLVGVDSTAIIAALGVLKAGKIYAALEETFPLYRHQQILADTGAHLILTDEYNQSRARVLAVNGISFMRVEHLMDSHPVPSFLPPSIDDPALINYTSGTTGKPKGVVQSHGSALSQAVRFASKYHVCGSDRMTLFQSLAWVGSFWVLFGGLCLGACIVTFDMRRLGMDALISWLHKIKPSLMIGFTMIREITNTNPGEVFPYVSRVIIGGDTTFRSDVKTFRKAFPNAIIAIGLGLSEAGRVTDLFIETDMDFGEEILPLGYPVDGVNIRLHSNNGDIALSNNEVTSGDVGEIIIESHHLAVGYWGQPELTDEKFRSVDGPDEVRVYNTGDLARVRHDGMLQYLGRADHVIKIHNLKVYPKEIESLILAVSGVKEVCLTGYSPPGESLRLVAYLVIDREDFTGVDSVYNTLDHLPNYMKPQCCVFLENMPHTPTGKIDQKRLPIPVLSRLNVCAAYEPPRNPTEKILTVIWIDILGIEGIGIHDNFLELGGDSITSTRIISKVQDNMNVRLTFNDVFNADTIAKMAKVIQKVRNFEDG